MAYQLVYTVSHIRALKIDLIGTYWLLQYPGGGRVVHFGLISIATGLRLDYGDPYMYLVKQPKFLESCLVFDCLGVYKT